MEQVVVTGATGLLGANLAAALIQQGLKVRCTKRSTSNTAHLSHLDIEWVECGLDDVDALTHAFAGCVAVFHCAAAVSVMPNPTPTLIAANVTGTKNVIEATLASPCRRLVHCSTAAVVAISADKCTPVTEESEYNLDQFGLDDGYVVTKRRAELLVLEAVRNRSLDAVIVNPSFMFGPMDARPSSGQMIVETVRGNVPGLTAGFNNFVDVRDVACGMISAYRHGKTGERYILSGYNMSYAEVFALIAQRAEVAPPSWPIPWVMAKFLALFGDLKELISGEEATLNSMKVAWGYEQGFIMSCDKAKRELGYTKRPLEDAIDAALEWFEAHLMCE